MKKVFSRMSEYLDEKFGDMKWIVVGIITVTLMFSLLNILAASSYHRSPVPAPRPFVYSSAVARKDLVHRDGVLEIDVHGTSYGRRNSIKLVQSILCEDDEGHFNNTVFFEPLYFGLGADAEAFDFSLVIRLNLADFDLPVGRCRYERVADYRVPLKDTVIDGVIETVFSDGQTSISVPFTVIP